MDKHIRRSKRFFSPAAFGGYGAIIVTLVIFFAQGGFGKMTPLTALYIIGLIIGFALILYGVVFQQKEKKEYVDKLLVDYKAPKLLEITDVLWQMSRIEGLKTREKLSTEVSPGKMENIRKQLAWRFRLQTIYGSATKKEL